MKTYCKTRFTLALFGLVLGGAVAAQQAQTDFPDERDRPRTCDTFAWNAEMTREHPRMIEACQEAVYVGGEHWARVAARFVRNTADGKVVMSIRDQRDRIVEEITITPVPGQVAYINERATPFTSLRTSDSLNLYVPEGRYGYATQPGASREQIATVSPQPRDATPARTEVASAPPRQAEPTRQGRMPDRLPATAGTTHWLALMGLLSLFAGLGVTLFRRQ